MDKFVEAVEAEDEIKKEKERSLSLICKVTTIIALILMVISFFMSFLPFVNLKDNTGEIVNHFSLFDLIFKDNEAIGNWKWLIALLILNLATILILVLKTIAAYKVPKKKYISYCLDYASGSFLMISGILQFLVIIMVSGTMNPFTNSLKIGIGSILGGITAILGAISVWFYASQKYKKPKPNKKEKDMIEKEA